MTKRYRRTAAHCTPSSWPTLSVATAAFALLVCMVLADVAVGGESRVSAASVRAYADTIRSENARAAKRALSQATGTLRRESHAMPRMDGAQRREVCLALKNDLVPVLIARLGSARDRGSQFALASGLYWSLMYLGDEAEVFVVPLARLLRPAKVRVPVAGGHHAQVLEALRGLGVRSAPALPDISGCLEIRNQQIVEAASRALAALGEPGGAVLIQRLESDRVEVRIAVARALAEVRPFSGSWLPKLAAASESSTQDVARAAIGSLLVLAEANLDLRPIMPNLRRLLMHSNPDRRRVVLQIVLRMGQAGAQIVDVVRTALRDRDPSVRQAAAAALGALGTAAAPALADLDRIAGSEAHHAAFRRVARISAKQIRAAVKAAAAGNAK